MNWPTDVNPRDELLPDLGEMLATLQREAADDGAGRPSDDALLSLHTGGVLRLPIPVEYGGLGGSWEAVNRVVTALARVDASVAIITFLHYASVSRIMGWGTTEQKKRLLSAVALEGSIIASSWSEPGSDAAKQHIATSAQARAHGGWRLSGAKSFTTGAGVASLYLVLARTSEAEGASGSYGQTNQGIFVVDAAQPGFVIDGTLDLVGMRRSATGLIRLDSYPTGPDDMLAHSVDTPALIGYPHTLGLTLGAVALGIAERAYDIALETARSRSLLDSPLHRHHVFQLGSRLAAVRGVVEAATRPSPDCTAAALTAKVFASEEAEAICRGAQEMAGSAGLSQGHPLNRLAQDARAITLMGPPNYLCRDLVTWRLGSPS
ncbi:acyl-CoA dehydrogenase family protein [Kitasatospora brasiliensis]|uniref:acyl-CoA dehydrogenase family protein n=1 Tax=Kitasatospora brasiliensis TaxID=3058040 RepID=UPI00292FAC9B|nr:acyl-CoA dehydrogenase family protein [Kitasatospora sp. K002]